jgi:branched-chain amino acid transport system ATP-binding protein
LAPEAIAPPEAAAPQDASRSPEARVVLETRSLIAGYERDINILNGVSVKAWAGRIACVLGPNGTGKSTLLKTIFGFLRPVEGEVLLDGKDIAGAPPHRMIGKGVTFLPQQPSLFPHLSVEVNLRLGLWRQGKGGGAWREAAEQAYRRFPVLGEKRRQPAGQLSGGQQRQLEVARASLTDPNLYLIDEPSAGVDPITSGDIYRMIDALAHAESKAVLLVDQDIKRALSIADYVYVVRNGALFTEGPRDMFGGDTTALMSHWLGASAAH